MTGKRQATTDLNHENWDREEEPEERGTFRAATEEEIRTRVMKKARRKIVDSTASTTSDSSTTSISVFSSFSGFGNVSTPGTSTGGSPFSFLSKIPDATSSAQVKKLVEVESAEKQKQPAGNEMVKKSSTSMNVETNDANDDSPKSKEYYSNLINLNRAFCDWIKLCVDNDPLCFLTPVFKDYEKFLAQLNQNSFKAPTAKNTETVAAKPTFSFSSSSAFAGNSSNDTKSSNQNTIFEEKSSSFNAPKPNGFTFNVTNATTTDDNKGTVQTSKSSGFSFTPSTQPFSFGNIKPPNPATEDAVHEDDEENQPPKTEFKQVVEDDAVYSKKCKVFVKKDENFCERGVGTLYLKPVQDSAKTQLLVRADTNLGNILVNLILSSGIPVKKLGKNNVLLVCVATPEEKTSAPMLLRVKNETEADELLATIEKYQK